MWPGPTMPAMAACGWSLRAWWAPRGRPLPATGGGGGGGGGGAGGGAPPPGGGGVPPRHYSGQDRARIAELAGLAAHTDPFTRERRWDATAAFPGPDPVCID